MTQPPALTAATLRSWGEALDTEGNTLGQRLIAYAHAWSLQNMLAQGRGEPDAYQYRWYDGMNRAENGGGWSAWEPCSKDKYEEICGYIKRGFQYQAQKLYADPAPTDVLVKEAREEAAGWRGQVEELLDLWDDQTRSPRFYKRDALSKTFEEIRARLTAEYPAPQGLTDGARYRLLFAIESWCQNPLWPLVDFFRDGVEGVGKAEVDAALDQYAALHSSSSTKSA